MLIYFFFHFLFLVVPLFLGLGILLCDNHFYYFHLPYHLFCFIRLCHALGTLQTNSVCRFSAIVLLHGPFLHLLCTRFGHGFNEYNQTSRWITGSFLVHFNSKHFSDTSFVLFLFFILYLYSIDTIPMKT